MDAFFNTHGCIYNALISHVITSVNAHGCILLTHMDVSTMHPYHTQSIQSTHMDASFNTHGCIYNALISHVVNAHGCNSLTHMDASTLHSYHTQLIQSYVTWLIHPCVTWLIYDSCIHDMTHTRNQFSHVPRSVTSHVNTLHCNTHIKESCHICMSHVTHE